VMLMIVVTVILAASVSAWSTGIAQIEKTPSGVFNCEIVKSGNSMEDRVSFRYISGDRIPSSDLTLAFIVKGQMTEVYPNSNSVHYVPVPSPAQNTSSVNISLFRQDGIPKDYHVTFYNESSNTEEFNGTPTNGWLNNSMTLDQASSYNITVFDPVLQKDLVVDITNSNGTTTDFVVTEYSAPWRYVPGETVGSYPQHNFGNYTITPGTTFKGVDLGFAYGWVLGGIDDVHTMISNWDDLTNDDIVTVKILHTPSGKVIWQSDVPVSS